MATRGGAAAIGRGDQVGTLAPGMRADLIQVDLTSIDAQPRFDTASHLVYVTDAEDVVTTIVEGRVLMRDGKVLTIDEAALREDVARLKQRIVAVTGGPAQAARNDSP